MRKFQILNTKAAAEAAKTAGAFGSNAGSDISETLS